MSLAREHDLFHLCHLAEAASGEEDNPNPRNGGTKGSSTISATTPVSDSDFPFTLAVSSPPLPELQDEYVELRMQSTTASQALSSRTMLPLLDYGRRSPEVISPVSMQEMAKTIYCLSNIQRKGPNRGENCYWERQRMNENPRHVQNGSRNLLAVASILLFEQPGAASAICLGALYRAF